MHLLFTPAKTLLMAISKAWLPTVVPSCVEWLLSLSWQWTAASWSVLYALVCAMYNQEYLCPGSQLQILIVPTFPPRQNRLTSLSYFFMLAKTLQYKHRKPDFLLIKLLSKFWDYPNIADLSRVCHSCCSPPWMFFLRWNVLENWCILTWWHRRLFHFLLGPFLAGQVTQHSIKCLTLRQSFTENKSHIPTIQSVSSKMSCIPMGSHICERQPMWDLQPHIHSNLGVYLWIKLH